MASINQIIDAVKPGRDAYMDRLNSYTEANGKCPTVDANGRLHAPCDGYEWEGKRYNAGEYLHEEEGNPSFGGKESVRFKVNVNIVEKLDEVFVNGSTGKSWADEKGRNVCYYYANVTASEKRALLAIIPEKGSRRVVLAEEGELRSWKFSYAKVIAGIRNSAGHSDSAYFYLIDQRLNGVPVLHEEGRKVKGKLREWYSPWDGKFVKYEYVDDVFE